MLRNLLILFFLAALPAAAEVRTIDTRSEGGPWVRVISEPEVVLDYSEDACFRGNFADLPVRAMRDADGNLRMFVSHGAATTYLSWKPGDAEPAFDNLMPDCRKVMVSERMPDVEMFAYEQWIASTYTDNGTTVHALVHNEFQGHLTFDAAVCPSGEYFPCWYNSITYARSTDSGDSFDHPMPAPDHLVASIPTKYVPDGGPVGVFAPSNIVQRDGFFYAMFRIVEPNQDEQTVCLMRTDNLADPASWQYWEPGGFINGFANPYRDSLSDLINGWCRLVAQGQIANMHESLVYHPGMEKFILLGTSSDPARSPNINGFYYAFSDDLVTWTHRRPLMDVPLPFTVADPGNVSYSYPSLIDPNSPGFNFEFVDDRAYLYFLRLNGGHGSLDRDLLRVEVQIGE